MTIDMANEIKIFDNPQFGEIRTIINEDGKLFFVASDVAKALGYAVPQKAVINHCKHCSKMEHPKNKGTFINIIPESDVYRLTMKSKLPNAEQFQDWVCEDVLTSIRKTGSYTTEQPLSPSELILKLAQMNVENERKMKALEEKQTRLESEIEEIKQRTTTDLHQSTIVAYVSRNNIKLDVKRYGAMGRKASTLCKKRNIAVTKINDVRWGKVNVFPDDILDEVFGMKGGLPYEN